MLRFYRFLIFILIICAGCKDPKQAGNVEGGGMIKQEIRTESKQIINSWVDSGITGIRFLKKSKWKIDDKVYLNSTEDKGYLLLLNQDLDPSAELDYVQTLYVAKEDGAWTLYLVSLPNLIVTREKENGNFLPNTISHLSEVGRNEMERQLKGMTTQAADTYINQEYTAGLKENQKIFLTRK